MQDVFESGTATAAKFDGMHLAGKTGTTNDSKDGILMGFSPYYTCGIWGGYDDNSPQSSVSYTQKIWKAVMQEIHQGLEDKDFVRPDGIVEAQVCKESGKRPVDDLCANDPRGSSIITEYFIEGTEPKETDTCDKHVRVNICSLSGKPSNAYCPSDQVTSSIKILGEINGSEEDPYRITPEQMSSTCDQHNTALTPPSSSSSSDKEPSKETHRDADRPERSEKEHN